MPGVWLHFKKSFSCCIWQKSTDDKNQIKSTKNPRYSSSGCSRSISNLQDVFNNNGDEQPLENPSCCSSRSLESSKFINTLKLDYYDRFKGLVGDEVTDIRQYNHIRRLSRASFSSDLLTDHCYSERFDVVGSDICNFRVLACRKCHERVKDLEAFESHYHSKHSVTKLLPGDFSRTTVELICNAGHSHKPNKTKWSISAILKVQNMQKTLGEFEDYRELVKIRTNKLPKKHPRCAADGNEFLGFHCTSLNCSLGLNNSSSNLCFSNKCGVCRILRHGFTLKTRSDGLKGVLTTSNSFRALECSEMDQGKNKDAVKAVVLCRVIAGRVHKPLQKFEDSSDFSGFDSLAIKMGPDCSFEELYLLSTKALLPCFVIIFTKPPNL